ncbi:MAG: hypothetical protein ACTSW1_08440 [Candidatus Hodarchaeales archaeon]
MTIAKRLEAFDKKHPGAPGTARHFFKISLEAERQEVAMEIVLKLCPDIVTENYECTECECFDKGCNWEVYESIKRKYLGEDHIPDVGKKVENSLSKDHYSLT